MNKVATIEQAEFYLDATIESIGRAESSFDVFKQLKATGAAFGLPRFLVTAQPATGTRTFVQRVVITNWDAELLTRFFEADLLDRSRISEMLRESVCPTTIRLSDYADSENPELLAELQAMIARGYDRVAYFPFQLAAHMKGAVSFTGARGPIATEEMAQLSYVACHTLLRLSQVSSSETPDNPLTDREIAVLKLAADGLTAEEIGRRIGITSYTVNYHVTNAIHKLGVKNKIQALVTALQHGWLAGSSR